VIIEGVSKAVQKLSPESEVKVARAYSAKYAARGPFSKSPVWIIAAVLLAILCVGCTVEMTNIATVMPSEMPGPKASITPSSILFPSDTAVAIPSQTSEPTGLVMPSSTPSTTETATAAPVTKKVLELAKQYRELRKVKGYFTGGEWNDDVDSSRGRLYTILDELRKALGNPSYKRADIVLLMGEPDAILAHDSKEYLFQRGTPDLAGKGGAEKNLLVYFWRGWHDYLYFVCQDEAIQEAGWYFALE